MFSKQKMTCVFTPNQPNWPVQRYEGSMTNLGIDLGATAGGVLGWAEHLPATLATVALKPTNAIDILYYRC